IRQEVSARFVRDGANRVGFQVGPYNHSLALTIDPVLSYSTYLGGSGAYSEAALGAAADAAGNVYVTGFTTSTDFPTQNAYDNTFNGGGPLGPIFQDIFVSKFDPAGSLVYSTYLGGSGDEIGRGIAVNG